MVQDEGREKAEATGGGGAGRGGSPTLAPQLLPTLPFRLVLAQTVPPYALAPSLSLSLTNTIPLTEATTTSRHNLYIHRKIKKGKEGGWGEGLE